MASLTPFFARREAAMGRSWVLPTALVMLMLGHFAWQGRALYQTHQQQVAPAVQSVVAARPDTTELSPSIKQLFGDKPQSAQVSAEAASVPESKLNVQVSAIFFVAPVEQSSVIIEDGDQTKILKRGEAVRPGIVVQRIQSDHVTLTRNGKLEKISLRAALEGIAPPTPEAPRQATESPPMDAPVAAASELATPYQQFIQRKLAQSQ